MRGLIKPTLDEKEGGGKRDGGGKDISTQAWDLTRMKPTPPMHFPLVHEKNGESLPYFIPCCSPLPGATLTWGGGGGGGRRAVGKSLFQKKGEVERRKGERGKGTLGEEVYPKKGGGGRGRQSESLTRHSPTGSPSPALQEMLFLIKVHKHFFYSCRQIQVFSH